VTGFMERVIGYPKWSNQRVEYCANEWVCKVRQRGINDAVTGLAVLTVPVADKLQVPT
jgi:hypothetical protein